MGITIAWLLIILLSSIVPVREPQTDLQLDKIVHFIVYGITAIVFFRVLKLKVSLTRSAVFSIIFASLFGLAMELLQALLPWREFSFLDEAANVSGALFFSTIYTIREYYKKR